MDEPLYTMFYHKVVIGKYEIEEKRNHLRFILIVFHRF